MQIDKLPTIYSTRIKSEWLDYNNHMNVAYYVLVFDFAGVELVGELGMSEKYTKATDISWMVLENHITYDSEVCKNQVVNVGVQLLDHDSKRMHLYFELYAEKDDGSEYLASTLEQMVMCVDLKERRACAFPSDIATNIQNMADEHAHFPKPDNIGRKIGIRR